MNKIIKKQITDTVIQLKSVSKSLFILAYLFDDISDRFPANLQNCDINISFKDDIYTLRECIDLLYAAINELSVFNE